MANLSGLQVLVWGALCLIGISIIRAMRPTIRVKNKVKTGMLFAHMVYTDEKGAKLLKDLEKGLQGKPDYIFRQYITGYYIPFEIKSSLCKEALPHQGDLMQLVAYFILVESFYGKRPPYGRLVYSNKTFKVRNTRRLRRQLLGYVYEMQEMLKGNNKPQADPSYIKCKNCICKETVCQWYKD